MLKLFKLQGYFVKWLLEEGVCMFCKSVGEDFYEMFCSVICIMTQVMNPFFKQFSLLNGMVLNVI